MAPRRDVIRARIAGGALLALLAACAIALTSACDGDDRCGCLCSGPADGEILALCSSGTIVDSDAANDDAPPE